MYSPEEKAAAREWRAVMKPLTKGRTKLHHAIICGATQYFKTLLAEGFNPNTKDAKGRAPLHIAQSTEMIQAFLNAGADPNLPDGFGLPTLHEAVRRQNYDRVKLLLTLGFNPNVFTTDGDPGPYPYLDRAGWCALQCAASTGNVPIAKLLIVYGAEVNHLSPKGITPIFRAVWMRKPEMVKFLLEKGARVDVIPEMGISLKEFATQNLKNFQYEHDKAIEVVKALNLHETTL